MGCQASTRGLGPFAERKRTTFRDTVTTLDIKGAQVSTIKNGKKNIEIGALSSRVTNPLLPIYQDLGRRQNDLRQDISYAELWKEQPIKKTCTRTKPEWKKSTVIPIMEDKPPLILKDNPSNFDPPVNVSLKVIKLDRN